MQQSRSIVDVVDVVVRGKEGNDQVVERKWGTRHIFNLRKYHVT
jgi:hypothetical protein